MYLKTGYIRIGLPYRILIKKNYTLYDQTKLKLHLPLAATRHRLAEHLKLCKKEGYSALEAIKIPVIPQTEEAKSVGLSVGKH